MTTSEIPDIASERARIRRMLRARRRALSHRARRDAAIRVAARICRLPGFSAARRIAAYLPFDGELDLQPLMRLASANGKQLCLPMIDPRRPGVMALGHLGSGTRLLPNRFGILEPWRRSTVQLPLTQIDVVLVPLVAFDDAGNRLGMGAGYYDRLLQRRQHGRWQRPLLIGTAFDIQRVGRLPCQPWDVTLDYVITEKRSYRPPQKQLC